MNETPKSAEGATNPRQYDSDKLNWLVAGGAEDSPSRIAFRGALEKAMPVDAIKSKVVLDVGSGVGHLFNWLKARGAANVIGIDPAERNIQTSTEKYPWATSVQSTLHDYAEGKPAPVDTAVCIMAFEHIEDLKGAFRDVHSLLKSGGEFYLIIGDKDFHIINDPVVRGGTFVSVEIVKDFGDGVVETKTVRRDGDSVMYDVFRPLENVRDAAVDAGFDVVSEKPLLGPFSAPENQRTNLVCHTLVFKKQ